MKEDEIATNLFALLIAIDVQRVREVPPLLKVWNFLFSIIYSLVRYTCIKS